MTKLEMLSKWDTKLLKNVVQNVNGGAAFPPVTKSVTIFAEKVTQNSKLRLICKKVSRNPKKS